MSGATEEIAVGGGVALLMRHWPAEHALGTVLLVHGAAEHSGRWEHVGEAFVAAGYDAFAYDMRGHGRSGGHPMYVEAFAEFLDDLDMVRSEGRPLVVYGHSFGGLVALAYGLTERPQPDVYVLSAPALGSSTPRVLRGAAYVLGALLPRLTAPTVFKKEYLSRDPAVGDAYMGDPHVHGKGTMRLGREVFRAMAETRRNVGRLEVPALVIHGGDDRLVPTEASAVLADVEGVERRIFEGLRHEMHNEPESEGVLAFVIEWLGDHLAATAE